MMVSIIFSSVVYTATLLGCYDGDTCTLRFSVKVPFIQKQSIRFAGFDTPEIRGKCSKEKKLAQEAKKQTINYLENGGRLFTDGYRGKYGRILMTAPKLKKILIKQGLAREYHGGKRAGWCGASG